MRSQGLGLNEFEIVEQLHDESCFQASKTIVEQFGVTTNAAKANVITLATLLSESDYNNLKFAGNFEQGRSYLESTIKPNKEGGQPVLVGVHYSNDYPSDNHNNATYHFIVIVGKGYDKVTRKHYFRFYDVGERDDSKAKSKENRLYVNEAEKSFTGSIGSKSYTITEIRKNF